MQLLINDDATTHDPNDGMTNLTTANVTSESAAFQTQHLQDASYLTSVSRSATHGYNFSHNGNDNGRNGVSNGFTTSYNWDDFSATPEGLVDGYCEGSNANGMKSLNQKKNPQFAKQCQRSILLANLPEGTTHADAVEVVRGGLLLDIHLRSNDRSCVISFLEEDHARDFFHYAKRNDIYIRNKRVCFSSLLAMLIV